MDLSSLPRALLVGLQAEIEAELYSRDYEHVSEEVLLEILA
ncbi:MAG: hypothetical protein BWY71_01501 [Planctomycetes bacterium ADurb.Bin412]|nr:MAG: hypothetical protein BWY71_01501 [Planctomycetes bacterium ADurb.Bin412]